MLDGGQWAWHACPNRGGTWLLPCNGGHILQAMHICLDTSFTFFTYHKKSSKALEDDVTVDLHVGWGPIYGLGMYAPLGGGTWLLPCNGGHILQAMHIWLDTSFPFFTYHKESIKA